MWFTFLNFLYIQHFIIGRCPDKIINRYVEEKAMKINVYMKGIFHGQFKETRDFI